MNQEILKNAMNAFVIESESLIKTAEAIDPEQFSKAVEVLSKATRIASAGCGHSGIACQHFAHLMCCIERPARFISPAEAVHGGLGYLQEGDVILLVSRGGKTDELIPLVSIAKAKGAHIVLITANKDSELARDADAVLLLPGVPESDRYGVMSTSSFASTAAIFDALMVGIMEEKDYALSDFALIHPGGAVGKKINL